MKRHKAKAATQETAELNKRDLETDNLNLNIEISPDVLNRITSDVWYEQEDMATLAEVIMRSHEYDLEKQFEIVGSSQFLEKFLEKSLPEDFNKTPLFAILNINNNHWTTFCVTNSCFGNSNSSQFKDDIIVLYKDSMGFPIMEDTKNTIQNTLSRRANFRGTINFKNHPNKEQEDSYSCGPMSLANMETIMKMLKSDKDQLVNHFEKVKFCSNEQVREVQEKFRKRLQEGVVKTITKHVLDLVKDEEFKMALRTFIKACSEKIKLNELASDYAKVLQEEIERAEADPNYEIDKEKIERAKEKFLNDKKISEMIKKEEDRFEGGGEGVDEVEIKRNYPEQMKKATAIFDLLAKSEADEKCEGALKVISEQLGLDFGVVKLFFQFKSKKRSAKDAKSEDENQNKGDNEESWRKEDKNKEDKNKEFSPKFKEQSPDMKAKSLEQLLSEIELGEYNPPEVESQEELGRLSNLSPVELKQHYRRYYKNNKEILLLEKQCNQVKELSQKWKTKDERDIRSWAVKKKLNKNTVFDPKEIIEALAVMDRANTLVTGGHHLRDTQILSILVFLQPIETRGRLCQIQTGEGKTIIVSLLATLLVLQGSPVDVVTSNEVLASEGVKQRSNFYQLFGITAKTNNTDEVYYQGPRSCYEADIVYGSMGNFQFDYLRDASEGLKTRAGRKLENIILDEVDNMLIDNGGYIAKLASPFPGVDSLKYVLIKIWQELLKAEDAVAHLFQKRVEEKAKELNVKKIKFQELHRKEWDEKKLKEQVEIYEYKLQEEYESFWFEQTESLLGDIIKAVKESRPAEIDLIPSHLKEYARDNVESWINSAIYSKYECKENEQYVIKKKDGEDVIVPVDYQNTGVTLKNTMWSQGIHQFVQLKHNLQVTSESLTSSFISNVGYIKLYGEINNGGINNRGINNGGIINREIINGCKIFGLTGTLGSTAEQNLLSEIYNVDCTKIPTYKPKNFEEFPGTVMKTWESWLNMVCLHSVYMAQSKRSVLIVCKTIKDLKDITNNIKAFQKFEDFKELKIREYPDEDSCSVVDVVVGVSEIIVATNIAGRGTDFKTTPELEENGGLHVCVPFLPVNKRVEDQAFGRTSRQGKSGTAQLILKQDDVRQLGLDLGKDKLCFEEIKKMRDEHEKFRLQKVQDVELREIEFQDAIYREFSKLYRDFKQSQAAKPGSLFLVKDLKEFWAFWLHKKKFKAENLFGEVPKGEYPKGEDPKGEKSNRKDPKGKDSKRDDQQDEHLKHKDISKNKATEEFQNFLQDAKTILGPNISGSNQTRKFSGGVISHNPFYSILQAEHFLSSNQVKKAEAALLHAIKLCGGNTEMLYSAYFKLFEVSIESGRQLMERFKKALKKVIFLDFVTDIEKNEAYLSNARSYLEKAKEAIRKEIDYILTEYFGKALGEVEEGGKDGAEEGSEKEGDVKPGTDAKESSNPTETTTPIETTNKDFLKILNQNKDNLLLKHISSRLQILITFHEHIKSLLEKMNDKKTTQGLALASRIPNHLKNLDAKKPNEKKLKEAINEAELSELGLIGLDTVYALKEVHDVPNQVIRSAQGQIAAGLAAFATGVAFPPSMLVMAQIAGALISEGICDIAIELISRGNAEFSAVAYIKGKVISYGITVVTMGLSAIATSQKILEKAQNACKTLASLLRKCPYLKTVCEKLAVQLERLAKYFERLIVLAKQYQNVQNLSKMQAFTWGVKSIGKQATQSIVGAVIADQVISKSLDGILKGLKPHIEGWVKKSLHSNIRKEELGSKEKESVCNLVNDILVGTYGEIGRDVLKDIALGVLRESRNWKVKVASVAVDTSISSYKIYGYSEEFCQKFNEQVKVKVKDKVKDKGDGDADEIVDLMALQVSQKIYEIICHLANLYTNTFVVNPVLKKLWGKVWGEPKKESVGPQDLDDNNNHTGYEILQDYENLELPPGATKEDIRKAFIKLAHKYHPNKTNGDKELTKKYMQIKDSYDRLYALNDNSNPYAIRKPVLALPGEVGKPDDSASFDGLKDRPLPNDNPNANPLPNDNLKDTPSKDTPSAPAHEGNIKTLSEEGQQQFVIYDKDTGKLIKVIGESHTKKPPMHLDFKRRTDKELAHYSLRKETTEKYNIPQLPINPSQNNDCFYECVQTLSALNGEKVTIQELRNKAEKNNFRNVGYGIIKSFARLFDNRLTRRIAIGLENYILVGGFHSRDGRRPKSYLLESHYPHGKIILGLDKEKHTKILKNLRREIDNNHKRTMEYNSKSTRAKMRHIECQKSEPTFGHDIDDKDCMMMGVGEFQFSNGKTLKYMTVSGSTPFSVQNKLVKEPDDYKRTPIPFQYESEGYVFKDPGSIKGKKIFDLYQRKNIDSMYSRDCALQKLLYLVGEYMRENPGVDLTNVTVGEAWYEAFKANLDSSPIIYESSCPKCQPTLPDITGKRAKD